MKSRAVAFLSLLLLPLTSALSQPVVGSVVAASDGNPDVALNEFAAIYGTGLSDAQYAGAYPWPTTLGPVQVWVCAYLTQGLNHDPSCLDLQILFASPTQIDVYIPAKIPGSFLTLAVNGNLDSQRGTKQYQIGTSYSPSFFIAGGDCYVDGTGLSSPCGINPADTSPPYALRAIITDSSGALLSSSNLAHIGATYTAWMAGLGTISSTTIYGTNGDLRSSYGGSILGSGSAISYLGLSGDIALYQMNFSVPSAFLANSHMPCGSYQLEVAFHVTMFSKSTSTVLIPLQVTPADLGCV